MKLFVLLLELIIFIIQSEEHDENISLRYINKVNQDKKDINLVIE